MRAVYDNSADAVVRGNIPKKSIGGDNRLQADVGWASIVECGVYGGSKDFREQGIVVGIESLGEERETIPDLEFLGGRSAGDVSCCQRKTSEKGKGGEDGEMWEPHVGGVLEWKHVRVWWIPAWRVGGSIYPLYFLLDSDALSVTKLFFDWVRRTLHECLHC